MRVPLAADLIVLARALMTHPPCLRREMAVRLINEADAAHRYFLDMERNHPRFGDGSLFARILALTPGPEPVASDLDFLSSLRTASEALHLHFRSQLPRSQL